MSAPTLFDPLPAGPFSIIYADPPWSYRDIAAAGNRGASFKYPTVGSDLIASLPVAAIAAKDCCLFIWVTMPKLDEVFSVINAWGFTYKTVAFTWVKTYPESRNKLFIGMGRWTRANSELCLLATKGKPKRRSSAVQQVIISPIQEHSRKPYEVKERILELCGDLPRIELFSREPDSGWEVYGNEQRDDGSIHLKSCRYPAMECVCNDLLKRRARAGK